MEAVILCSSAGRVPMTLSLLHQELSTGEYFEPYHFLYAMF